MADDGWINEAAAFYVRIKELEATRPVVIIGEETIAMLRSGQVVELSTVILLPASDLILENIK